jgi:hypothetical protein
MDMQAGKRVLVGLAALVLVAASVGCGEAEKAAETKSQAVPPSETSVKQEGQKGGMVPDFSIDR